jgi:hypothetical protein
MPQYWMTEKHFVLITCTLILLTYCSSPTYISLVLSILERDIILNLSHQNGSRNIRWHEDEFGAIRAAA